MVGGRKSVDTKNEGVVKAANYGLEATLKRNDNALVSQYKKVVVESASTQVVAGINYFLDVKVLGSSGDCVQRHAWTVYDRFGDLSLTSDESRQC